ncbi:hypothetical protein ABPG72_002633 [Tetrahymena utriculariae]
MEQQSNSFNNLDDFVNSNLKDLKNIDLQLKNFSLNSQQLALLNTSLMKCTNLESLILNLQKESISDFLIYQLYRNHPLLEQLIRTRDQMSNDQIYAHIQFLFNVKIFSDFSGIPKVMEQQGNEIQSVQNTQNLFKVLFHDSGVHDLNI